MTTIRIPVTPEQARTARSGYIDLSRDQAATVRSLLGLASRTYTRKCECGECERCRHREYMRRKRAENEPITAR